MLKHCCTTGMHSSESERALARRITTLDTELASVVRAHQEVHRKLDDALYEVQILEGAVKDRDKKIKFLEDKISTQDAIIVNLRSDMAVKIRHGC